MWLVYPERLSVSDIQHVLLAHCNYSALLTSLMCDFALLSKTWIILKLQEGDERGNVLAD